MSDAYNQPMAHDRTRDRDVIDAAFLISRVAGERGVTADELINGILGRIQQQAADQANIGALVGVTMDGRYWYSRDGFFQVEAEAPPDIVYSHHPLHPLTASRSSTATLSRLLPFPMT